MENNQEKPTVSSPTSTALLCCPFCGSEAFCGDDDSYGTGFIGCANDYCKIDSWVSFQTGNVKQKESAISAWNQRAT